MSAARRGLALALLFLPGALAAQQAGETVIVRGEVDEDRYLAGGRVDVDARVSGDVTAAGGELDIGGRIDGDAMLAGGSVTLDAEVTDDARLAGGRLHVDASIGDDLVAAGGQVELYPGASVGGRAWLAGGRVTVAGTIGRELRAAGGELRISATVHGPVDLTAERIEILPGTRIDGDLLYRSPAPVTLPEDVEVGGDIVHRPLPGGDADGLAPPVGFLLVFLLAMGLTGGLLQLVFPGYVASAAGVMREAPWRSLGLGALLLLATPLLGALLASLVLGLPLALALLGAYPAALLTGLLLGLFGAGRAGARLLRIDLSGSRWRPYAAFLAALALLTVLLPLPLAGALALLAAVLLGAGAGLIELHRRYRGASAPPAAAAG